MKLAEGTVMSFSGSIRTLINELAQSVNNEVLLINLMKGYRAASDKAFADQMHNKLIRIMNKNDPDRDKENT